MRHESWAPVIPHDEYARIQSGAMAQRRDLFCRNTALAVPMVMLGLLLLAGAVFVSNQVIASRLKIDRLRDRRDYLEAKAAHLQARWNSLTTAEAIETRAQEIGLIVSHEPQMVLLQTRPPQPAKTGVWDKIMSGLDGATALEAATDPLTATRGGNMVILGPRTDQDEIH